jgi:hypothetical protein
MEAILVPSEEEPGVVDGMARARGRREARAPLLLLLMDKRETLSFSVFSTF